MIIDLWRDTFETNGIQKIRLQQNECNFSAKYVWQSTFSFGHSSGSSKSQTGANRPKMNAQSMLSFPNCCFQINE